MLVILNSGAYRMHRAIAILYVALSFVLLFFLLYAQKIAEQNYMMLAAIIMFIFLSMAHVKAAVEVKIGTDEGRRLTRILGIILLLGFPVGTLLGLYLLVMSSSHYWESDDTPHLKFEY